ncbi:MAG: molybdopterin converting factor subunit 1 [Pikeienuella sp.]
MINVLYFAWMRERIDLSSEQVDINGMKTVADLITHLRGKGERYEAAFADMKSVRIAVDQKIADHAAPLSGAREVAFFPPMTGG